MIWIMCLTNYISKIIEILMDLKRVIWSNVIYSETTVNSLYCYHYNR